MSDITDNFAYCDRCGAPRAWRDSDGHLGQIGFLKECLLRIAEGKNFDGRQFDDLDPKDESNAGDPQRADTVRAFVRRVLGLNANYRSVWEASGGTHTSIGGREIPVKR